MKKTALVLVCLVLFVGLSAAKSEAMTYNFFPVPALNDLRHDRAYTWGISWAPEPLEFITEARLEFKDIYNWGPEANDRLYANLLDDTAGGVNWQWDWQNPSNYFSGQGAALFTYTDLDDNASTEDYVYNFTPLQVSTLSNYAGNGNFGFGFDPDCHYYNSGAEFTIQTGVIPEPATISLLGMGLLSLIGFRKKP